MFCKESFFKKIAYNTQVKVIKKIIDRVLKSLKESVTQICVGQSCYTQMFIYCFYLFLIWGGGKHDLH